MVISKYGTTPDHCQYRKHKYKKLKKEKTLHAGKSFDLGNIEKEGQNNRTQMSKYKTLRDPLIG